MCAYASQVDSADIVTLPSPLIIVMKYSSQAQSGHLESFIFGQASRPANRKIPGIDLFISRSSVSRTSQSSDGYHCGITRNQRLRCLSRLFRPKPSCSFLHGRYYVCIPARVPVPIRPPNLTVSHLQIAFTPPFLHACPSIFPWTKHQPSRPSLDRGITTLELSLLVRNLTAV